MSKWYEARFIGACRLLPPFFIISTTSSSSADIVRKLRRISRASSIFSSLSSTSTYSSSKLARSGVSGTEWIPPPLNFLSSDTFRIHFTFIFHVLRNNIFEPSDIGFHFLEKTLSFCLAAKHLFALCPFCKLYRFRPPSFLGPEYNQNTINPS